MFFPLDARQFVRFLLGLAPHPVRLPLRQRIRRLLGDVVIAVVTWHPRWSLRRPRRGG